MHKNLEKMNNNHKKQEVFRLKRFLITALIIIPLTIAAVVFSNDSEKGAQAETEKVVFSGIDLSCENCKNKVVDSLDNILGIDDYSLDPKNETITVWYNQDEMKPEWIYKSLEAAGFRPENINR